MYKAYIEMKYGMKITKDSLKWNIDWNHKRHLELKTEYQQWKYIFTWLLAKWPSASLLPNIHRKRDRETSKKRLFFNFSIVFQPSTENKFHHGHVGKCFPVTKYLGQCLSLTLICHTSPNSPPLACQTWGTLLMECLSTLQKLLNFSQNLMVSIFYWIHILMK